jgi:hypothetical protein
MKLVFMVDTIKYKFKIKRKKLRKTLKERINLQVRYAICTGSSAMNDLSRAKKILTRFFFITAFVRKMEEYLEPFYRRLKYI